MFDKTLHAVFFAAFLAAVLPASQTTQTASDIDYQKLADACKQLQNSSADPHALGTVLNAARLEHSETLRPLLMGITSLAALLQNNQDRYASCLDSLTAAYPTSPVTKSCARETLIPVCRDCHGSGKTAVTSAAHCSACNNSGKCAKCRGSGKQTGLKGSDLMRCLTCKGNGRCSRCATLWKRVTDPITGSATHIYDRSVRTEEDCPKCNGIPAAPNLPLAAQTYTQLLKDTHAICTQNSHVQQALKSLTPDLPIDQQVTLLENIIRKFPRADLIKSIHEKLPLLKLEASTAEQKRAAEKNEENQRIRALTQEHGNLLSIALQNPDPAVAVRNLQLFIDDHPSSPIIQQAQMKLAEKQHELARKIAANKRNRTLMLGFGAIIAVGFIISCIQRR